LGGIWAFLRRYQTRHVSDRHLFLHRLAPHHDDANYRLRLSLIPATAGACARRQAV